LIKILLDEDIVNTTPTNTNSTAELFETSTSTQIQSCSANLTGISECSESDIVSNLQNYFSTPIEDIDIDVNAWWHQRRR
jgi:hypothetical protein